ncbi:MAG: hypothetical protein Q8N17_01420 [Burkholderiaceae bacterium]|nr:hypothetical protein [Burkholderiaceae bacterium]
MDADTDAVPRSDILDLTTKFNAVLSYRGAVGGICDLDGSGLVPVARVPTSIARVASPTFTGTPAAPTAAAGTNTTQLATTAFVLANAPSFSPINAWPVGSVYTSVVNTNPATLLGGGTWAAFGTGRTLVGIDTGQAEFNTAEGTGGAKTHTLSTAEMPSHTHSTGAIINNVGAADTGVLYESVPDTDPYAMVTGATGGGGAHNNLQPYIVVYFWKRTA